MNDLTRYTVDAETGCWLWRGYCDVHGYGGVGKDGTLKKAHRLVYEALVGPIPEGHDLDHTCHNGTGCPGGKTCIHRRCVNPDHLEPVPRVENIRRGARAKLTPAQVAEIRGAERTYGSQPALARRFGVSVTTIACIRRGGSWKDIEAAA